MTSRAESPRARRVACAALIASALAFAFVLFQELFENPSAIGYGDYYYFHHDWEFGRQALLRFHELPLWNPFFCGGYPDFGDPQSQVHHPLFLLSLIVGSTLGLKLFVVAHAAGGFAGMYVFVRREESLGVPSAVLAALVWTSSGFFAWHCGTGHGGFVGYYLAPWLLFAWRRALLDVRAASFVAGIFGLVLAAGGANALPHLFLLLLFDTAVLYVTRPRERRGLLLGGISAGLLTLLLGAWRFLPVLEHVVMYPRVRDVSDALSPRELLDMLARAYDSSQLENAVPGHPYSRVEYGGYLGVAVLGLAVAGAVILRRKGWPLLAGVGVFGSLALGDAGPLAPWLLLKSLPVFGSLQAPSRFVFAVCFFLVLLAAHGLNALVLVLQKAVERAPRLGRAGRPLSVIAVAVAVLAPSVPVVLQHRAVLAQTWRGPPLTTAPPEPELYLVDVRTPGGELDQFPPKPDLPTQNVGTGWCYTGMGYKPARGLWAGPGPQVTLVPSGTVHSYRRTTRTFSADVELKEAGRVVFNQTHSPGWRSNLGEVVRHDGLSAVDLPPGRHQLVLRYAPASSYWGALFSAIGLAAALSLLRAKRERGFWTGRTLAFVAASGAALLVYGWVLVVARDRPQGRSDVTVTAQASDYAEHQLHDRYGPGNAVDGNAATEWLASPGRIGWLELKLGAPTRVHFVRLLNARNLPYGDFQSLEVDVETYRGNTRVRSVPVHFETAADKPRHAWVSVGGDEIDLVRVVVRRWTGRGGGIAEVELR